MELDNAFEFAVILAWGDLRKVTEPCSVRVEYRAEPGAALDDVSVWLVRGGHEQELVCAYWTRTSSAHPSGVRFSNGHWSDQLAQTLDRIMKNQDQFTRRADACRDGLVLIYPPTEDERAEAAAWKRGLHGPAASLGGAADEKAPSMAGRILGSEPPWADAGPITPPRLAECDRAEAAVVSI